MENKKLAIIEVVEVKDVESCEVKLNVDDDLYAEIVEEYRSKVPGHSIFEWWFTEGLKESLDKLDKEEDEAKTTLEKDS